ncbi:MAG TPA: amidohydrolase family protein [Candidatus Limnocylindrales bacterium]|nr:amidohydrolase family protein [Candidatus Limnocylindrales bacterium]
MTGGRAVPPSPEAAVRALRVDAHQHFWNLESGLYAWPTAAEPAIHRTFTPDDLAPEVHATGIDATVVVQATDSLADTDAMIAAAGAHAWVAGVVGWLPLADRAASEEALEARAGRLCGVRHLIHWDADPEWLMRPQVQPGLVLLAERGLPFDVVAVFPRHLPLVPAVADAHPDLVMIIDHLAKPPFRAAGWELWVEAIRRAAARANVFAKVSGLDTAAGPGWTVEEIRPAWDVALDAFGPDRLLFGSDWPVCRLVSTYREVAAAARALVAELTTSEQDRILGGNAIRLYRIELTPAKDQPGAV